MLVHTATVKETHAERAARTLKEAKKKGNFIDLSSDDDDDDDDSAKKAAASSAASSVGGATDAARVYNTVCAGSAPSKTTREIVDAIKPPMPIATVKFHLYELVANGKIVKVKDFPPTWQAI